MPKVRQILNMTRLSAVTATRMHLERYASNSKPKFNTGSDCVPPTPHSATPPSLTYLFATRPEPLVDSRTSERSVPIERVFRILAAENATMRALWTAEIVGAGTKAGLKFDEKWREPAVAAGPLPALFLRESATALQKNADPTRSVSRIRLSDRAIELVYRRAGQTF